MTVDAQARFERSVLVALIALVVSVAALVSEWLGRANAGTSDHDVVQGGRLETAGTILTAGQ